MPTLALTHILDHQFRKSRGDNSSNHIDSFTFSFLRTMSIMTTDITFVEGQLVKMTHIIVKLIKTIKEKYLQITSLINKIEVQAQTIIESSYKHTHPLKITSLGNANNWIGRQIIEFASMAMDSHFSCVSLLNDDFICALIQ